MKFKLNKKLLTIVTLISSINFFNYSYANSKIYQSWETNVTSMPVLLDYSSTVLYKDYIYYIGGYDRTSETMKGTVQVYNTKTNTWSYGADMPTPRGYTKSVEYNGKIYCFGGTDSGLNSMSGNTLNTFEIYDIESNTWSDGGLMPEPKEKMGIEIYQDKILIIGGITDRTQLTYSTNINIYNLKTNTWESNIGSVPEKIGFTTQIYKDKLYIFGGNNSKISGYSMDYKDVNIYNLKTNTWSSGQDLSIARHGTASVRYGINTYIFGGRGEYKNRLEIEVYNLESNKLNFVDTAPVELHWGDVILNDGILYCVLGERTDGILSKVILCDLPDITVNSDIYIRPLNVLSLSLDTNIVSFEDFDTIEDVELLNAIELNIESSLPYKVEVSLASEIKNGDGSKVINPNILSIKASNDNQYNRFESVGKPILIYTNQNAGEIDKVSIDIKVNSDVKYSIDAYKTSMKIEVNQL